MRAGIAVVSCLALLADAEEPAGQIVVAPPKAPAPSAKRERHKRRRQHMIDEAKRDALREEQARERRSTPK